MYVGGTQATRVYFTELKYDEKSVAEIIDKYLGENPTTNTDTSDTDTQFAREYTMYAMARTSTRYLFLRAVKQLRIVILRIIMEQNTFADDIVVIGLRHLVGVGVWGIGRGQLVGEITELLLEHTNVFKIVEARKLVLYCVAGSFGSTIERAFKKSFAKREDFSRLLTADIDKLEKSNGIIGEALAILDE